MKKTTVTYRAATALALTALLLVGCANVEFPTAEVSQDKTVSEILGEIEESLPETSEFQGETLTVLTADETVILGDESAAGSVRGALKNRNSLIASMYGMEVEAVQVSEDAIAETLKAAETAGVAAGDLLCYSAETTLALRAEGLLANLTKLPYFSISGACSNTEAAKALMTGSVLHLLPDPSAHSYDETYVLFYDRALVRGTGMTLPETLVNAGNWDLAMFRSYAEAVASSVMGRTSYDLSTDVFGYSTPDHTDLFPYLFWRAQGYTLFSNSVQSGMSYNYTVADADELMTMASPLIGLYASKCRYPLDGQDAYDAFEEGRLGFLVAKLGYLKELYVNADREYGILPLPKANGSDGGYTCVTATTGRVLSAPALMSSEKRSGLGLTAICAAGGSLLHAAEKQTYVTLYSSDNDQSCMLETVLDAATFDFGFVFSGEDRSIAWLSTQMLTDVVANGSKFDSYLRNYVEKFGEYAVENLC